MIKQSLLLVLLIYALPVSAENLQITDAWIKNLPAVVPVRAGYMKISNTRGQDITILSLESKLFEDIHIHQTFEVDGVASMRAIGDLTIRAGESLELAPGGFHLMMMNPLEGLTPGQKVVVTLHYQDQKTQTIEMVVRK
jgi:copper(I)-binding protein